MRTGIKSIGYADGTIFEPPVLLSSSNGWIYKPDEIRTATEIKRGTNKSWPRKTGYHDAEEYLRSVVRNHFEDRQFQQPISVEVYDETAPMSARGNSFVIGWRDRVWGWVSCAIEIHQAGTDSRRAQFGTNDVDSITYKFYLNAVGKWVLLGKIPSNEDAKAARGIPFVTTVKRGDLTKHVNKWIQDPFGVTSHVLDRDFSMVAPRQPLTNLEFKHDWSDHWDLELNEVFSMASGNAMFYRKGVLKKVMTSDVNWNSLNELIEALAFTGYEVSVRTSGYYTHNKQVSGIQIDIPEQGNNHAHRVTIDANNPQVSIDCGFIRDEARYLDFKKRKAVEEMRQLEETLKTFEIDLGEEGVE